MKRSLILIVILGCITLNVACQKQVISEKSYSPDQFSEYSHLPRKAKNEPQSPDYMKKMGDGAKKFGSDVGRFFKDVGSGLSNLNPWGAKE